MFQITDCGIAFDLFLMNMIIFNKTNNFTKTFDFAQKKDEIRKSKKEIYNDLLLWYLTYTQFSNALPHPSLKINKITIIHSFSRRMSFKQSSNHQFKNMACSLFFVKFKADKPTRPKVVLPVSCVRAYLAWKNLKTNVLTIAFIK